MLSSVFSVLVCAAIPVADPLQTTALMPPTAPAVQVGSYVTATTFRCRNFGSSSYLLVFGKTGTAATVPVALPAGAEVAYHFTPEEMTGMFLEVVSAASPTAFATSGAIPLALPASSSSECLWFVPATSGLDTWRQIGCEVEQVQPTGTLLPSNVGASDPDDDGTSSAVQTPIAVPTNTVGSGGVPPPPSPM